MMRHLPPDRSSSAVLRRRAGRLCSRLFPGNCSHIFGRTSDRGSSGCRRVLTSCSSELLLVLAQQQRSDLGELRSKKTQLLLYSPEWIEKEEEASDPVSETRLKWIECGNVGRQDPAFSLSKTGLRTLGEEHQIDPWHHPPT